MQEDVCVFITVCVSVIGKTQLKRWNSKMKEQARQTKKKDVCAYCLCSFVYVCMCP